MTSQMALRTGENVILKSGGHVMTVHNIGEHTMQGLHPGLLCVGFDDRKRVEDVFHPATLEPYDEG